MHPGRLHAGEPDTGSALVRRLVAARFPAWADLPVEPVATAGTSNAVHRLGTGMSVRLPRTAGAARDVDKEHTWLPRLAPLLPAAVPLPLGRGEAAEGYPWPWSVHSWLEGERPAVGHLARPELLAADLAAFTAALHRVGTAGGPPAYRSEPLASRDARTRAALAHLAGEVDTRAATTAWEAALRAPDHRGPAVWIHADLQPGNLLVTGDRLAGVIDFGCLGLGDPAVDLIAAWYVLPAAARPVFRTALGADGAAWARGRGWALSVALLELEHYRATHPVMAAAARRVIGEVLADHAGGCAAAR
ncbi:MULTISPECIES: aminoglycoside phosphotransferase family protein [Streptomyces]|uniref:aminoglycoside phosphotransferase family protein n=1 Tax=Streptomyces TaxID=1883 RepID=UPI001679EE62|nr:MULTISPECIES: aminoglycoside phosphotransferase family protein [Streptomyces]MBD3575709.1 aminoglycoside phosphotransferase family protein [Streptomyces sp. KD18]GGT25487.1 hypothetical protein GCM10010286_58580 [Streptomyces toxytricini]